jgi:hypothetical protein
VAQITITPGEIVRRALLLIGAVDREKALTGTELNDGLDSLNMMLASWAINKLKIPSVVRESFTLTVGDPSYTIGESSANFSTERPHKILSVFIRDAGNVDYILEEISRDRYNEIFVKGYSMRPYYFYYHPTSPNGTLYLSSAPSTAETIYIDSQKDLANLTDPDTAVTLPTNYFELMINHLAIRLAPEYELPVKPETAAIASELMADIHTLNSESFDVEPEYALVHRVGTESTARY